MKNQIFRPSVRLKRLYYTYWLLALLLGFLSWFLPLLAYLVLNTSILVVAVVAAVILIPALAGFGLWAYWIPRYYESISYNILETELVWRRGVWFRQTGIVPYNRITNIDISQGPLARRLGLASLKIQTAGYSAPAGTWGRMPELRIDGVERPEELKETVMAFVRGAKPEAVEVYAENLPEKLLRELVKIREVLERLEGLLKRQ
jgi:hypothetical protein